MLNELIKRETSNLIPKQVCELEKQIFELRRVYLSLLKELSVFASNGDLSENADWCAVNERKENLFAEIAKKELRLAVLKNSSLKKVQVEYLILSSNLRKVVILIDGESSPAQNFISRDSILGIVLDKAEVGETKEVITSEVTYNIKILEKK